MPKRHRWLLGALINAGLSQRDVAKAWHVDDAVVSRFIATGKPDLAPERQMLLSQMLGMTNDTLLANLYGGGLQFHERPRGVIPLPRLVAEGNEPPSTPIIKTSSTETLQKQIQQCVDRLQQLLPGVTVTINLTYKGRD